MKNFTTLSILFLLLASMPGSADAQSDYRMQSVFLYNFTRLIAWPSDYQSGEFVVAVYGKSDMYNEVKNMAKTKKAGNQKIVAKQFNSAGEISKCHIMYIPDSKSRNIDEVVSTLQNKGIKALIVTESRNATQNGSVINFTIVNNRQRFELSQENAKAMGLNPGSEIQRLAILAD
ncbi:MAG: YfiR family protein [Bacteroidota bacterium]